MQAFLCACVVDAGAGDRAEREQWLSQHRLCVCTRPAWVLSYRETRLTLTSLTDDMVTPGIRTSAPKLSWTPRCWRPAFSLTVPRGDPSAELHNSVRVTTAYGHSGDQRGWYSLQVVLGLGRWYWKWVYLEWAPVLKFELHAVCELPLPTRIKVQSAKLLWPQVLVDG